jgi:NAD(P)-dependent dehydrogenase (short-subunit alcohol dehydrogenase family)
MDYFKEALEGKIGVVSGAGSGQGRAVIKLLLENGAAVMAFSRSGSKLGVTHSNLTVEKADSTDISSLERVAKIVREKYGRIDFLYNNHGIFSPSTGVLDGPKAIEFFQRNVVASINTASVFLPMIREGGSIVNVGASPSIFKHASLEYAVSKSAVEELTRKMASLLRDRNIRVNAIMPGSVDSSKDVDELKPFSFPPISGRKTVSNLEVAYVSIFLLSSLSNGINGQSIIVDGGAQ